MVAKPMKPTFKPFRIFAPIALLALATSCATTSQTTQTADMLTSAGFKLVDADTPQKQELLKTLPTGQLSVVKWKGKTFYVEPAATPNHAYVGTEKEYHAYEGLRIARQLRNDQILAAQMRNADMARWQSAWGPSFYGGYYGHYYHH
jgi:hypothetical protein